jgi:hypothetical protein
MTNALRDAVHQLTTALYAVAYAIDAGVPPRVGEPPGDEVLKPVTDAVRPVLSVLGSGPQPARPGAAVTNGNHGSFGKITDASDGRPATRGPRRR